MKPFFHFAPQIVTERAFYAFFPLWQLWLKSQQWPPCEIVHGLMGFASEPFDHAERIGALKVVDCPNSHPTTYAGFWQRECDLWCPGERVPVPRRFLTRMNRELERADVILCPSNFVRDSMVLNGVPADKCFINPFGVDTTIFVRREALPGNPRFIAIGTICVRKGFQYLFRAMEIVRHECPSVELIVVGDYKTDFRRERGKWEGTFSHIRFLPLPELASLLKTCTAFVFPSTEEGLARVIPMAMAAGLPIIASHESGATTLVEDKVQGLIVRPRDPQHIAEAMLRVAMDPELNRRMGAAAHASGALNNSWQDYGDRLLAEYRRRLKLRNSLARQTRISSNRSK